MEVEKEADKEKEADSKAVVVVQKVMEEEIPEKEETEVDLVIMVVSEVVMLVAGKVNKTSKNSPH